MMLLIILSLIVVIVIVVECLWMLCKSCVVLFELFG